MTFRDPSTVRRIAIVGAGVIGSGWAAHFLARGYEVAVQDPDPVAADRFWTFLDAAWPTLEGLGLAPCAARHRVSFSRDIETALEAADFVQECAPDDRELKAELFALMDAVVPPGIVIASSTSGIPMTDIQAKSKHPERMVVGHPFNPPYLIPLVEVVGGRQTAAAAVEWATAFYRLAGKWSLRLDRELLGFVANRLQEALWREVLHMVSAGEATVEQIDAAVVHGPGVRWAIMGPCLTFHLAGGEQGIRHMLQHFEHALLEPWCRMEAPPLTDSLYERMEEGCRQAAADRPMAELIRDRDEALVRVLAILGRLPAPGSSTHLG
jgi:carnitine 3-dehydrogenase